MKSLFSFLIIFYKACITPIRRQLLGQGVTCRYSISCSDYALLAIEKHGTGKGLLMALKRLAHCHPFAKNYELA